MRTVDAIKVYREPQQTNYRASRDNALPNPVSSKLNEIRQTASNLSMADLKNSDRIVNSEERSFFMKMFPDNSSQIENHVLFNRNGRLQVQNLSKGMIIDGRI